MFLFGPRCPRCNKRNPKDADTCKHCGAPFETQRPPSLQNNRWEPSSDELAAFFYTRDLKGVFSQELHVPAGMRAWVMQDSRCVTLQEGDYTVDNLFSRLNNFFQSKHGEILVTRRSGLAVPFHFDDIPCADLLALTVDVSFVLQVDETNDLASFRSAFMGLPGVVAVRDLASRYRREVRQALLEALGRYGIEELMARRGQLRQEVVSGLNKGLAARFAGDGLILTSVESVEVRHQRFDKVEGLKGELWFQYEEAKAEHEHKKRLQDLYDAEELSRLEKARAAFDQQRRANELSAEEAEFAESMRLRELDKLEIIKKAETRKAAIEMGAADEIARLEHEFREKAGLRSDKELEWKQTRWLAEYRAETERKVEEVQREGTIAIARDMAQVALDRERLQGRLALALEERNGELIKAEAEALLKLKLREEEARQAEHQIAMDAIAFRRGRAQQEAERIALQAENAAQELRLEAERKAHEADIDRRRREIQLEQDQIKEARTDAEETQYSLIRVHLASQEAKLKIAQQEYEQERQRELNALKDAVELQRQKDEAADRELERELKRKSADAAERKEERQHELDKLTILGSLPSEALLLQADSPEKVDALIRMHLATQAASGRLDAGQMQALATVVSANLGAAAAMSAPAQTQTATVQEVTPSNTDTEESSVSRQLLDSLLDRLERMSSEAQANMKKVSIAAIEGAAARPQSTAPVATAEVQPAQSSTSAPPQQPQQTPVRLDVNVQASAFPAARVCSGCGIANASSARFCDQCGRALQ